MRFVTSIILSFVCVTLSACAALPDSGESNEGTRGFLKMPGMRLGIKGTAHKPSFYTVTVGVNKYQEDMLNLNYAAADAHAFHEQMNQKTADSVLLLDDDATRESILGAVNTTMNKAKPGDTMVIFIASHGILQYNDFYILGHDARTDNVLGTGIPAASFINALSARFQAGINVLLVLDTCHSGGIGFDISKFYKEDAASGMTLFVSSQPNETSIEGKHFGGGHGAFSHFLVEGLKGAADANQDNIITLRETFNYTYNGVRQATDNRQHPVLIGTLKNDLILKTINTDQPHGTGQPQGLETR